MEYAYCKVTISAIRNEDNDRSEMTSQCLFGEAVYVIEKKTKWIKIKTVKDSYIAWADINHFESLDFDDFTSLCNSDKTLIQSKIIEITTPWGIQDVLKGSLLPLDFINNYFTIGKKTFNINSLNIKYNSWSDFANSYINTPYLWGGSSPFGIDCSAFTQIIFKFRNINIPRDAYQQAELGVEILFNNHKHGDLAFFQNDSGKITHVGILLEENSIIHSSSWVRIDKFDENGIYSSLKNEYTHHLKFIKRI